MTNKELEEEFTVEIIKMPHYKLNLHGRAYWDTDSDNIMTGIIESITQEDGSICFSIKFKNPKPATYEPKFKVGDRVKFVYNKNEIAGTISEVDEVNKGYGVLLDDGGDLFCAEEDLEPYIEPRWTFTDDEKVILRNLLKKYRWIARDECGDLVVYTKKPKKIDFMWYSGRGTGSVALDSFGCLFKSIKVNDDEPCEFRKYI